MKVLIVEEALKALHGHWFQYISDIVYGGQQAGHEIEVAVHREACPEILQGMPCHPVLSSTVFDPKNKSRGFKRVVSHNLSLYRDLSAFFATGHSYDVVIAPTVRLDHLLAYGWLASRAPNRGFTKLVLIMIESIGQYSPDYSNIHFPVKSLPLRWVLMMFRWLMKTRLVHLVAESAGHARQFEQFCGIKFPIVPHVTTLPPMEPFQEKDKKEPDNPLVLATFGFTRYDKGLDILQEAIKILLRRHKQLDMRFVLQWTGDYRLPNGSWVCKDPELEGSAFVQYIPSFSASEEYYKWIARTDIMVLPYRKKFYYDKLSRVAIDAALAGMPFLYPSGTWLESFANRHGAGVPFHAENPASLVEAVWEATTNFPQLKAKAMAEKQQASAAFSAKAFFDIIFALPRNVES